MPEKYIVVTELFGNTPEERHAHSNTHPVLVALGVDSGRILIQQGNGHGLNGSVISNSRFCSKKWKNKFKMWNCLWFSDLIMRSEGDLEELIKQIDRKLMKDTNMVKTIVK